jgi:hypothetical protein
MNHFCTYCDRGYAARLLCLHDSLVAQGEAFRLHVLCFDAETETVVTAVNSPGLVAIPLTELLAADPAYAAVRSQRSRVEFYFTATPVIVRHCLAREPLVDRMTYLDADLFFYRPPSEVFAEQGEASIGIVPHRFPPHLQAANKHGTYNVAWVSFRRDREGLACLEWWRERCLEWCHDHVDQGRFADQGYLDEFPRRFRSVRSLEHPGINAAPWNMENVRLTRAAGQPRLNDRPLLFYHFQGIREIVPGWFDPGLRAYHMRLTPAWRDAIYLPYLRRLAQQQRRVRERHGIQPMLGYHRLTTGGSVRDRWERFKGRWLLPAYRRWCGQLLHVAPAE